MAPRDARCGETCRSLQLTGSRSCSSLIIVIGRSFSQLRDIRLYRWSSTVKSVPARCRYGRHSTNRARSFRSIRTNYEEIITVIAGEATVTVACESTPVHADMSIVIPPHTPHGYKNSGDGILRMIASFPNPDAVLGKLVDPPAQSGESTRP